MTKNCVLCAVFGLVLLMLPCIARADDEEDRARELLEALGGSTPVEPVEGDQDEQPAQEDQSEPAEDEGEAPLSYAEGGKLPGDLSDLLEGYVDENGELNEQAAANASEEVQASAADDTPEGRALREALDSDGDGAVDAAEAQAGVDRARELRQNMREQAGQLFFKHDTNSDGQLGPQEFTALAQEMALPGSDNAIALQFMFGQIDADQNGAISAAEAQRAANTVANAAAGNAPGQQRQRPARGQDRPGQGGPQQLDPAVVLATQQIIQQFDRNSDGMIGPREAANNPLIAANFNAADTNGDERLTGEEIYAYIKSQQ